MYVSSRFVARTTADPVSHRSYVEALGKKLLKGELRPYTEGRIPAEVRSWSEWIGGHH